MLDLIDIFKAAQSAILAIVLHRLIQPGMIFGAWGKLLARKQWAWPEWVRYPLGDCFTCFSGQIGLWTGIAFEIYQQYAHTVIFEPVLPAWVTIPVRIAFYVILTIYFADILNFHGNRNKTAS